MVDLASGLSVEALARAFHEAGIRYGTKPADVEAVLRRRRRLPGTANLRAEARARGDDFRRFTFGDVERPGPLLTELAAVLS
jgi:hypothetical protein